MIVLVVPRGPRLVFTEIAAPEPIGTVLVVSDGQHVVAIDFGAPEGRLKRMIRARFGPVSCIIIEEPEDLGAEAAIRAYLAGDLAALDNVPIDPGGTPFQREVWAALRAIPPGETQTYGALAKTLGRSSAARAVGRANALNPISLVVPCHRLVGADAALTGYGGGLDRKRWLLDHERQNRAS